MAKATFKLSDGTEVTINGSPDEIRRILSVYGPNIGQAAPPTAATAPAPAKPQRKRPKAGPAVPTGQERSAPDLTAVVRALKEWDRFDAVEKHILDKSSQADRTLLSIYAAQKLAQATGGLTSGEISKITRELGVPVSTPNVSNTLSGSAQRYVHGDTVRRKGQPVRYQLTRRGIRYVEAVVSGTRDAVAE